MTEQLNLFKYHCGVCNKIYDWCWNADRCPYCQSGYVHEVGRGCEEMASREAATQAKSQTPAAPQPDGTPCASPDSFPDSLSEA